MSNSINDRFIIEKLIRDAVVYTENYQGTAELKLEYYERLVDAVYMGIANYLNAEDSPNDQR